METVIWIFGNGLFHHAVPCGVQRGVERRWRQRLLPQHLEHDAGQGSHERLFTRQKLVQDDATRKEVTAEINGVALKLLGRHVRRGAHHGAGHGELGGVNPRNAKVGDLDPSGVQHNQVGWLDVAVDHAIAVRMVQRIKNLHHETHHVFQCKALIGVEIAAQLAALDKLHGDEGHPLGLQG